MHFPINDIIEVEYDCLNCGAIYYAELGADVDEFCSSRCRSDAETSDDCEHGRSEKFCVDCHKEPTKPESKQLEFDFNS